VRKNILACLRLFAATLLLLFTGVFADAAQKAEAVRKDAFLSQLLAARGFETTNSVQKNAAFILKSGIVTDAVENLAGPATRRDVLRWAIQSLGLSVEAQILSGLDLSSSGLLFKDAKSLSSFDRACLLAAARMTPPLFKNSASNFGAAQKISSGEASALLAAVKQASRGLKLNLTLAPAPGMTLELHRQGVFSGVPKWRVHIDGFDDKTEADGLREYLASQGFETEPGNPNYEWRLSGPLLEDYAQARRLVSLAEARGKSARVLPSLMNADLENQPLYWALLTIDPARYTLEPVIAPGGITTLAPLSSIVKESGVRAAINAGFFAVSGRNQGFPIGVLRIGGTLVNTPYQGRTCLGWSRADTGGSGVRAAFGEVTWSGQVRLDEGWLSVDSLNRFVKGNAVTLYNPFYGRPTPTGRPVTEVLVKAGRCVSVTEGGGAFVEPGHYVLAGYGTNAALLARLLQVGDVVKIDSVFNEGDSLWGDMANIVQAGPYLIRNGEIRIEPEGFGASILNLRHPRSVIGLTGTGKWVLFTGDGRDGMHSAGFTVQETAEILKAKGVAYALNLDGGGSTELLLGDKLLNSPSEKRERPISYGIGARARQEKE
jgi:hypothetical protein